jgi:hypothetical protein
MITLAYDTERCLDGLTIVNGYFRPLSERREPVHLITADLDDPVVLRLLNARDDLLPFMARYSAGEAHTPREIYGREFNVHVGTIASWQRIFRDRLTGISGADQVEALISLSQPPMSHEVSFHLQDGKPRILIRCERFFDFLRMEAATIAVEGAKLVACGRCGDYFLTGPGTSRRTDAQFCSDKCRVAAMRARKKEGK